MREANEDLPLTLLERSNRMREANDQPTTLLSSRKIQLPPRSLDRSVGEDRLSGCLLGGLVAPKCRWNELIARGRRRNSTVTQYSTTIPLVGNPSGVPGKSHVCSNADDTVPRSATVSFALDSLSDGVSSVQFTPSSTISPQEVESCSLG